MAIKIPDNELQRLNTLVKLKIFNTDKEEVYENIVSLACSIMNAPMAAISLIAGERQWAKAIKGGAKLPTGEDVTSVAREDSFAAVAILTPDEPLIIKDTLLDERFINNPNVVEAPKVRFLVAIPLVSNGNAIGALCAADTISREAPSVSQIEAMKSLAKITIDQLELREFIIYFYEELHRANIPTKTSITQNSVNLDNLFEIYHVLNSRCDAILDKLKARKENKVTENSD